MSEEPARRKHIILGAGGAIGQVLAHESISQGESVKLVSRREHTLPGAVSTQADLLDRQQTVDAIEPNAIVYLLAGLPYRASAWQTMWPTLMANVIAGCQAKDARLIFFDNIYMYGRVEGAITEDAPINPCSKKGEVRARIAEDLLSEARNGNLYATIARAADFYGPFADTTSVPYLLMIKRLAAGKSAQVLVDPDRVHSYTFTGDCGKALYHLSRSDNANATVWHLPTARPALTSRQFIDMVAQQLNVKPKTTVLRKWMVRLAGLFDAQTRELHEMLY
ncbi:MAG: NAD-dependent epimerase/dehydratase family protein, partial [candidate division Zixibacteria bacterium]|nr:NAD-dependent epimerase/dehydratase family protein [candidate division Zixibacteria bacterium]